MSLRPDTTHWSLSRRQLVVIGGALTILSIVLGVGGAWFASGVAERMSDRMLAASARSISDTIGLERGHITLEIPPSAFGMLEDNARDNVYYSIRHGSRLVTGYAALPQAMLSETSEEKPTFRYGRFLDQDVRIVAEARHLPQTALPVVVQVAETLDERGALTRRMMLGFGLLEATLVGFAVLLIRPAIRWGLKPVTQVQREINSRDPNTIDFTHLDSRDVPPELAGLITGFNQLLTQLGSATERSRRFTADASHQMRTPVAVLRAHIDLLQHHSMYDAETMASIGDIDEATDRLQRLLTQLLSLARVEQDADQYSAALCDAAEVAQKVCVRLAPLAVDRGIDLHLEIETTFLIQIEALLLEEMLSNFVDNAILYNQSGKYVVVRVGSIGNDLYIEVEDDGPGIPQDYHDLVMQRFFRLPRDSQKTGSGLGLSIAAAIAERAGATLRITSAFEMQRFSISAVFPKKVAVKTVKS